MMEKIKVNKYRRWYNTLMAHAKNRKLDGYCERHHIKMRALGGTNKKSNIVKLTYREHFLAHWLLTKFLKDQQRRSACLALAKMHQSNSNVKRIVTGWQYEISRCAAREAMMGNSHNKGFNHTTKFKKEQRIRMQDNKYATALKGRKKTPEHCAKISAGQTGVKSLTRSKTLKGRNITWGAKISAAINGRKRGDHGQFIGG